MRASARSPSFVRSRSPSLSRSSLPTGKTGPHRARSARMSRTALRVAHRGDHPAGLCESEVPHVGVEVDVAPSTRPHRVPGRPSPSVATVPLRVTRPCSPRSSSQDQRDPKPARARGRWRRSPAGATPTSRAAAEAVSSSSGLSSIPPRRRRGAGPARAGRPGTEAQPLQELRGGRVGGGPARPFVATGFLDQAAGSGVRGRPRRS